MKSKKVSQKKSPIKINISKFLSVEFNRHSNSQIYIEISRKTFFTFYYFFPKNLQTVKLALCHRANVNKTETVFKERMLMFDG